MSQSDVILVGASVRSFAQSAMRDGLRPICVDMFCDADLRLSLREHGLSETHWCRHITSFTEAAQAVADVKSNVPAIVLGGLENHMTGFLHLSSQRTVRGPDWKTIEQLRDPLRLFPRLRDLGCCVPRFHVKGSGVPVHEPGLRWLHKRRCSSGGQGIRWYAESEVSRHTPSEAVPTDDLQEFIDGIPISASFLATVYSENESVAPWGGVQLLGCALQLSGCQELHADAFHFCGNVGPLTLAADLTRNVVRAGRAVAAESSVSGLFGIDFVVRDGRPFIVEVNPRPTASHELHERGRVCLPGHVSLQLGQPVRSSGHTGGASDFHADAQRNVHQQGSRGCWARFVIYADQDVVISDDLQSELLSRCVREGTHPFWLADIPSSGTTVTPGTPLCSLYADLSEKGLRFSQLHSLVELLPLSAVPSVEKLVETIQARLVVLAND
jgi:predicted ATP-grasp superfamily ATP-dependent carboligase